MVRIRGGDVIINIELKDHLLQLKLEVDNYRYIALRECGHICSSEEALRARGCINCAPLNHAPDCIVCGLLNTK